MAHFVEHVQDLSTLLARLDADPEVRALLLFVADRDHPDPYTLSHLLQTVTTPLIGGLFPELIVDGKRRDSGMLVIPLSVPLDTMVVPLSDPHFTGLDYFMTSSLASGQDVLFVFADALARQKETFIHTLYHLFGSSVRYLGGGCGSLSFQPFPCVLHNTGVHQDAAVLGLGPLHVSLGVAHGWSPLSEPLKVTRAEGNRVMTINWEPAMQVYRKIVEAHSGQSFDEVPFFDLAKSYPLGMIRLGTEMVIRDPFATEGDTMLIVDHVAEGEYVRIMHGSVDSLLSGAALARAQAEEGETEDAAGVHLCVDCISRVLFLRDEFDREVDILSGTQPLNGILSIGEIANQGEAFLDVYNKTVVLAAW